MAVPRYYELFNPVISALQQLGSSTTIEELNQTVISGLQLSELDLSAPHNDRMTELEYQLHWTRSYLKAYGILENSKRGVWAFTPAGRSINSVDPQQVVAMVRKQSRQQRASRVSTSAQTGTSIASHPPGVVVSAVTVTSHADATSPDQMWKDDLLKILLAMQPDAFERLCQRLLRESGFVEVKVTGKSADGGIDGVGHVRLGGLLSFPVLFQCKRYKGSVDASTIRDFRGAMVGRADRGLVITTGRFTAKAHEEATRDGAPPIDLLDGDHLLDKLKELGLGIRIEMVEQVTVLPAWFQGI